MLPIRARTIPSRITGVAGRRGTNWNPVLRRLRYCSTRRRRSARAFWRDRDNEASFTADSLSDMERVVQTVWGGRALDDLVMRRQNNNYAGGSDTDYTDTGNPADRGGDYFLTDLQFSVAAVISSVAVLVERVSYDAYGEARYHCQLQAG
jgi:hypothetical protein